LAAGVRAGVLFCDLRENDLNYGHEESVMNVENKPTTFSVAEAKAKFSELLLRAEAGERLTVTRHGRPVVDIVASEEARPKSKLRGAMKGKIWIAPDFDELGAEWDEYVK